MWVCEGVKREKECVEREMGNSLRSSSFKGLNSF